MHLAFLPIRRLYSTLFLTLFVAACQQAQPQIRQAPLPQDPFIQVYFNHAQLSEYVEPYRKQRRSGDDLEQLIVNNIAGAKSTIDVAVQELRLPKIAQALVDRKKAGVKVRVILENIYSRPWSKLTAAEVAKLPSREQSRYNEFRQLVDQNRDGQLSQNEINLGDALVMLENAGVPIINDTADGSAGSGLMHHKFVIVDGQSLIVTSANFTTSDIHGDFKASSSLGNANSLLKIDSPELAEIFAEEFNIMWGDGPGGKPDSKFGINKPLRSVKQVILGKNTVELQFSPSSKTVSWEQSSNGLIGKTLNTATKSVDMALFVFSEQRLADILETNHERGVEVRAVIDRDFAYRPYSEALDMMGVALPDACKVELNNRPWKNPITSVGISLLRKGDLLHHKFAVVDEEIAIAGSHNWSEAANSNNDETLLVIQNKTVAAHFQREFNRLYADAELGLPEGIKRKIQTQQQQCSQIEKVSKPDRENSARTEVGENQIAEKVNLNTASQAELEALPGVGPKLAQQIILTRQQKPFASLEDLDKLPGVGPNLLEKLKDRVTW